MDRPPLGIGQIQLLLPHRSPMLLVDRVLEISADEVVAEKLVSASEPALAGHFPARPIMPGVLILEALAQAAAIGVLWNEPQNRGRGLALLSVRAARFRRPVVPGEIMRLSTRLLRKRAVVYRFEGSAAVRGEIAAQSEFLAAFVDWEEKR